MSEIAFKSFATGEMYDDDRMCRVGEGWIILGPGPNSIPGKAYFESFGFGETEQGAELLCKRLNDAFVLGQLAGTERTLCPACHKLNKIKF
jgi:hypothetical protein